MSIKDKGAFLKQYEIMSNTTQNVTAWRQTANAFYLTITIGLLSLLLSNLLLFTLLEKVGLAIIGIIISILWFYSIDYYRKLNTAKFKVIEIMEKDLPLKMFTELEYKEYRGKIKEITEIEKNLPLLFLIINFLILVYYVYLFIIQVVV